MKLICKSHNRKVNKKVAIWFWTKVTILEQSLFSSAFFNLGRNSKNAESKSEQKSSYLVFIQNYTLMIEAHLLLW